MYFKHCNLKVLLIIFNKNDNCFIYRLFISKFRVFNEIFIIFFENIFLVISYIFYDLFYNIH